VTRLLVVRAADFQATLYYSLLLFAILFLILLGTGYALAGVRRLWRAGERGPAAALAGAVTIASLAFIGMYAVAIGGLVSVHGLGT
jgi:hypothetical protein